MTDRHGPQREAARQAWLIARLQARVPSPAAEAAWLAPRQRARGLAACERNAAAAAGRALGGMFPTVLAMLGDEPFASLACVLWAAHPPVRGDLGEWGHGLPQFIAADASLRHWPYLADCARLDLLVAACAAAEDARPDLASLALLADTDPDEIGLRLSPGLAVIDSAHPVVTLWQAHRDAAAGDESALSRGRVAVEHGVGECARVWRDGWRATADTVSVDDARFTMALCRGDSLGSALRQAGDDFAFEPWLVQALQQGWLLGAVGQVGRDGS